MRILALLESEELAVQELMEVLGMAQSRVSRHLANPPGSRTPPRTAATAPTSFYRFALPEGGPWRETWKLVQALRAKTGHHPPTRPRGPRPGDLAARASTTRRFFDRVGPEWDELRLVFNDEALRARAVTRLVPPDLRVADVGTGTGILAAELARLGVHVVAVDHSERMLEAARAKLSPKERPLVDLRHGEASALPLSDGEVHAAFAHMVLHYLPSPAEAIREMARVVSDAGVVTIVDFVSHDHEWMREELGVAWLGFEPDEWRGCGSTPRRRASRRALRAGRAAPRCRPVP